MAKKLRMAWAKLTGVSLLAFGLGWLLFGLGGAVVLVAVVLALMGILTFK